MVGFKAQERTRSERSALERESDQRTRRGDRIDMIGRLQTESLPISSPAVVVPFAETLAEIDLIIAGFRRCELRMKRLASIEVTGRRSSRPQACMHLCGHVTCSMEHVTAIRQVGI